MQGLVLQLTRAGFLLLLWLAVWLVVGALRSDARVASGMRPRRTARTERRGVFSRRGNRVAKYLVVTHGPLANTRITLSNQPVLIGRADDSTLVLTDDYASTRHARLSRDGDDWFVEDLGSTNGTYLDRNKVTTPTRVPLGTPVRVGKTVIELRP
ncbi:FHA domain-containing protein [Tsukamurella sp. 8F]|uniref:FHA domain-containing protein FhaB/FipA n=1 Tax=unclassified Tsukamurella TaxID=2633480 RepID=UPI0023B8A2F7|nr:MULTISPECIES: FHA domain-containing protein [unclassified Tsukamurella]MDF0529374.1 FHA domain-containing protein [Tsukamurella sp. 8J]MDF0587119.1 FHA domain-containing protein [Tsukamurella sp. 8F]